MKPARIIVLIIAVVAGGIAALLAGRSPEPPPALPPVAQIETTDVLVANSDIGLGHAVAERDLRWQTWPTAAAGPNFIRKNDRPDAIRDLAGSIARAPFSSGEPIREAKLIKAKGSGYMAAILPSGMRAISVEISPETGAGGFILPNDHVDVILSRRDKMAEKSAGVEVHTSEVILSNVRVLAIDQTVEEKKRPTRGGRQDRNAGAGASPSREARGLSPAGHTVARASQPDGLRQRQAGSGRRRGAARHRQHGAFRHHQHDDDEMK